METDSEIPVLPEEITRNILKRLPVKSLIRFQCVCRHWKNLIKSRSFVAEHLQHSNHQNLSLLLEWNPLRLSLLDCGFQVRRLQNAPSINSFAGATIVGSCNGVLCVEIDHYKKCPPSILLWNPANGAYRYVPRRTYADAEECVVGFGFSPVVNDYKIVRTYAEFDDAVNRVEVFSLNRGSWKGIDIGNLKGVKLYSESVTANGAIFWFGLKLGADEMGEDDIEQVEDDIEDDEGDLEEAEYEYDSDSEYDEYDIEEVEYDTEDDVGDIEEAEGGMVAADDETEVIVAFDIAKEVFTLLPRPDLEYNANERLTVYDNKLAILCDIWDADDEMSDLIDSIDLWVMEEGTCASGKRWSWTKIYTSSPCSYTLDPMTIWRNQIVCKASPKEDNVKENHVKGKGLLYLLNLTTNEAKRFDIPECSYANSMCNYVESLVSFGTYRRF